ncbi:hypothetical protein B9Z55_020157 [Caenorhabditis nigoni]|uniref:Major facilitator superfamily (MFS) profile domain-containing protein n=2 Tax=Caenorhabditis nigoni TaxID=1611254 RepID=A0A2G5TLH2_9PELO|nr:hypothetical protein B9Z55_020157 [Caenorhabditis nigoni]
MSTKSSLWSVRSVRLRVAMAVALALTIEGLMRSNLNMAIVCMLNSTALTDGKPMISATSSRLNTSFNEEKCPLLTFGGNKTVEHRGTIYWTSHDRAIIFAAFYVGGLVATLCSEFLNRYIGPTRTVFYGAVVNVLGTFVTPFVASTTNFGTMPIMFLRFLMGFGQGVLWPCMLVLVSQWFPANEKSTALAIATTGNQLSVVIAMFATAELCQLPLGWPMAFHTYAVFGIVLCVLWYIVVHDSPCHAEDVLSKEELHYITTERSVKRPPKTRWLNLAKSPVVWSIAASSFAHNYVTVGTITYLPLYYKTILNMSLTSNGVLSALPFLLQLISKVVYVGFADIARRREWASMDTITKICNSSASFGIAICFGLLCFADCTQRGTAIFLVCMAMSFVSGYIPGYSTSVVTIAPAQTAGIAAFSRFWGQIASSVAPYHIGAFTKQGTPAEWMAVFSTMGAICIATGVFFHCCGTVSLQNWDSDHSKAPIEIAREELIDSSKLDDSLRITTVD